MILATFKKKCSCRHFPEKKSHFFWNKLVIRLVNMNEGRKRMLSVVMGKTGSATVVYPLLLNYGLSAGGVDSFDCPVELRGEPWLPSPIAAQLVRVRLFNFKISIP